MIDPEDLNALLDIDKIVNRVNNKTDKDRKQDRLDNAIDNIKQKRARKSI